MLLCYNSMKYKGDGALNAVVILLFWECLPVHKFVIRGGRIL